MADPKWNEVRPPFIAVYLVAIAVLMVYLLVKVDGSLESNVSYIRTDMEVHRSRNEAAHQCMMDALAKLPTPDQRQGERFPEIFVAQYRKCVDGLAPTIKPPHSIEVD